MPAIDLPKFAYVDGWNTLYTAGLLPAFLLSRDHQAYTLVFHDAWRMCGTGEVDLITAHDAMK